MNHQSKSWSIESNKAKATLFFANQSADTNLPSIHGTVTKLQLIQISLSSICRSQLCTNKCFQQCLPEQFLLTLQCFWLVINSVFCFSWEFCYFFAYSLMVGYRLGGHQKMIPETPLSQRAVLLVTLTNTNRRKNYQLTSSSVELSYRTLKTIQTSEMRPTHGVLFHFNSYRLNVRCRWLL